MVSINYFIKIISIFVTFSNIAQSALPPQKLRQDPAKEPITLNDFLDGTLNAGGFGGSWIPGSDDTIRFIDGRNVWEYNVATQENRTVVNSSAFDDRFGSQSLSLSFSKDNSYILIEHSRRNLWRHSYLAKYDVLNLATGEFTILQPTGLGDEPQVELQLVVWASSGNSLAFIYGNNIYYKSSHAEGDDSVQITSDGGDAIFNGISDWVYEEEMYGSPVAMWFSTDSSNLAFVRFDDSNVEFYQWPLYGEPGVRDTVYPTYEPIRYPKAGQENPIVSLHLVNLADISTVRQIVYPPEQDKTLQYYIATVKWASPNQLLIQNLNRQQDKCTWNFCSATDAACIESATHSQTAPAGWIDPRTPTISQDGTMFLTLLPQPQVADPDGRAFTQIVAFITGAQSKQQLMPITASPFHVDSILGFDEAISKTYFSGSGYHPESSPMADHSERHIYYVTSTNMEPVCISCDLKTTANEDCRSNSFSYSANYAFYTHTCRGPGVPETTTRNAIDNTIVHVWNDNAELRERLENKLIPSTFDMEVDLPDRFKAKVRLYLPPNFDETKSYPLLIDVYAGPDSQKITQDYKVGWETSLASSKGVIVGNIDVRGSARRCSELKFAVNRNLGSVEIEDQIAVTKHLITTLSYIDANKTGIWGWSYGGYATAMALGKDVENVFKCGISVAPVSSWLYYDTIYTERYMGLPSDDDNWVGYNSSSVMNNLESIRNKEFLLIHGNADDNVHYQHSMMLARALEQADIMFDELSYPEENHGINGPFMQRHLYHSIEHFLSQDTCFGPLGENPEQGTTTSAPGTTVTTPTVSPITDPTTQPPSSPSTSRTSPTTPTTGSTSTVAASTTDTSHAPHMKFVTSLFFLPLSLLLVYIDI